MQIGDYLSTFLRTQLIAGLRNPIIQARLLEISGLTFKTAVSTAVTMELAESCTLPLRNGTKNTEKIEYMNSDNNKHKNNSKKPQGKGKIISFTSLKAETLKLQKLNLVPIHKSLMKRGSRTIKKDTVTVVVIQTTTQTSAKYIKMYVAVLRQNWSSSKSMIQMAT